MEDWPELNDAARDSQTAGRQALLQLHAASAARVHHRPVGDMAGQVARLERWQPILGRVEGLAHRWVRPVTGLLAQVANATWDFSIEPARRPDSSVKLILALPDLPPSILWEVRYARPGYIGWYALELRIDQRGWPVRFLVECLETGYNLSAPPELDRLKWTLVDAYQLGPVVDLNRRLLSGLPLRFQE